MGRTSTRRLLAAFAALPLLASPALAQSALVAGRVLRADSTSAAGIRVVLHRVGRSAQGPLDSARSDGQGRFRFRFRADTTAFYLLSGRYSGIEYFSPPVATNPAKPDTGIRILVYDTSSSAPVSVTSRDLVVTRPGETGARGVLDLIGLRNAGTRTRVAPDTLRPTLSLPLPQGTLGLSLSEGDMSPAAVTRAGDSVLLASAISPGEKQLTLQYQIPAKVQAIALPVLPGLALNVLAEESGVAVTAPGIASTDSQVIQGRSFRRWTGTATSRGELRIALPQVGRVPRWLLPGLVGLLALGLVAAGWYGVTRRRTLVARGGSASLIDSIAALDARFLGRQSEVTADEWQVYQSERARLLRLLEAALASEQTRP